MAQHAEVSARWDPSLSSSPHSGPVQPGEASRVGNPGGLTPASREAWGCRSLLGSLVPQTEWFQGQGSLGLRDSLFRDEWLPTRFRGSSGLRGRTVQSHRPGWDPGPWQAAHLSESP